ncbi:hypothetical protein NLG97_g11274 [Lecanicillium saksenae]|uniref:Uncharacterized protein n=1 Tax=Lecanicillium saksenae TaxID=468837 RepID=A0ACC1QCM8_9HYPO|nr:hypothetical protein NLG97_g11274 [Lecanicillium saksenae]
MALAHLKKLQELTIIPMYALDASLSSYEDGLADDDFIALFAELRDLQVLQFEVQCRISQKAFYSLAGSCPSLLTCTLLSDLYLRDMEYGMKPDVVFRNLVGLSLIGLVGNRLTGMVIDIDGDAKDQVELFRRFMPNLEELSLHSEDIFSQAVSDVFDNRNGESDLEEMSDRE